MSVKEKQDIDWEEICSKIADKDLVPIIGNEMFTCGVDAQAGNAEAWFAQQLKNKFEAHDPSIQTLTAAVEFLVNKKNIEIKAIRRFLKSLSREDLSQNALNFPLLEEFATIEPILFFINTTPYGNILQRVLKECRGRVEVDLSAFALNDTYNVPASEFDKLDHPFVFNIMGDISKNDLPSLLEEEKLEVLNSFIESKQNTVLNKLLVELGSKMLLFIGCGEPSWMTRFLYRNLSNNPLSSWGKRGAEIIIVNDKNAERDGLFEFLAINNAITYEGETTDFVKKLTTEWAKYERENHLKPKNIFISYSHKDLKQARLLVQRLSMIENVKIFFDEETLQPGDNYQKAITHNIFLKTDLFIPLISKNSIASDDNINENVIGEWRQAYNANTLKENDRKGKPLNYLMPVAIDDVDKGNEVIKRFFNELSIADVPGGVASESFIDQVKNQLNII